MVVEEAYKIKKFKRPISLIINLTTKCNLSCLHCFGDYGKKRHLPLEDLNKIVNEIEKEEIFYVNLTGGEPTQHPNFEEFIDLLSEKNIFFILTTNGVFSKKIMDAIVRNKKRIISVKISLDGFDPKSNNFIRRKEGLPKEILFDKILQTIRHLKKEGIKIVLSTVLHQGNVGELERFYDLLLELRIDTWLVSPLTFIGRAEQNKDLLKYQEDFKEIIQRKLLPLINKLKERGIDSKIVDLFLQEDYSKFHFLCGAASSFCEIHSDGTVSPCALARSVMHEKYIHFENIFEKSLKEIWEGESFEKFRSWQNKGCEGCSNFNKCNRCVPQSFLYFSNAEIAPPFCISIGDQLGLKNLNSLRMMEGYLRWVRR